MMRHVLALLLALAMLGGTVAGAAAAPADASFAGADGGVDCVSFEATQQSVCFAFRSFWQAFGGLAIFGYPITGEFVENGVTVQYFERARFEWHPGAAPAHFNVLLGRLGSQLTAERQGTGPFAPAPPSPDPAHCTYFEATGHNACFGFQSYWKHFGGLAIFGYPISEEFVENGVTVQYFERARFEWHPGAAPARYDVLLGLLGVEARSGGAPAPAPTPTFTVVVSGLNNPRGMTVGPDGALYVAEAGLGGDGPCLPNPEGDGEVCYGPTGSIARIVNGEVERIATGLPSLAAPGGGGATGVHDVVVTDSGTYALIGLGADPAAREQLGDVGADLGTLVRINEDGTYTVLVDVAADEAAANPEPAVVDSNPFSFIEVADGFVVVDAGGNDVLHVAADGTITTLAVFGPRLVDAPPFLGLPPGTQIPMESVPTGIAVGPDGAYYVGELTGFPFQVGGARIWRVVPGEAPTVYAEGFTNIIDLAFAPDGSLYVLEIAADSLLVPTSPGALYRLAPDGTRTLIAREGLVAPAGLAIDASGAIYVANMGVMPGQGQVVQISE
ncbi:MAG: ScyD/ScyE family protein [Sphaerobacter sp.]|nr:ScyD/ScyE family protein [Sphaerobacter sp.]